MRFTIYKFLQINKFKKPVRSLKKSGRGRIGRSKMERWAGTQRLLGGGRVVLCQGRKKVEVCADVGRVTVLEYRDSSRKEIHVVHYKPQFLG